MFAVVRTGGKQYRVAPKDVIQVERLKTAAGEAIELGEVLAMSDGEIVSLGRPLVEGARVAATVVEHIRGEKIIVFRKKRRKNYRRKLGHRQELTVLRIDEILAAGEKRKVRRKKKAEAAEDAAPEGGAEAKKPAKAKTGTTTRKRAAPKAKPAEDAPATVATAETAAEASADTAAEVAAEAPAEVTAEDAAEPTAAEPTAAEEPAAETTDDSPADEPAEEKG